MTGDQGEDLSVEPYGPPAWFFLAPQLFLAVLRPSEAEPLLWRSRLAGLGHAGAEELVELRRRPRSAFRHLGVGVRGGREYGGGVCRGPSSKLPFLNGCYFLFHFTHARLSLCLIP